MIKKLHVLIVRAFVGPFLASFSVGLFVLVLQLLVQYQEEIFGKGLGFVVIGQIIFYMAMQMSVLALPIAILIASLSTYGRLGETYELAAIKSAGVSLFQAMYPMIVVGALLCMSAFYLSWFVIPRTNLQMYALIYDAGQAKPQWALKPGYFAYNFDNYCLYFARRNPETEMLYDVKIWDHTQSPLYVNAVYADSATIEMDHRLLYLNLRLYKGERHEARPARAQNIDETKPYARLYFDTLLYRLDMKSMMLQHIDPNAFRSHHYMQTIGEFSQCIDSLKLLPVETAKQMRAHADRLTPFRRRFPMFAANYAPDTADPLTAAPLEKRYSVMVAAANNARSITSFVQNNREFYDRQQEDLRKYRIEYYMKFSVPLASLLMLFIGAPLGALIRKGGLGTPTVISLGFFVLFYLLMTQGRKLAREDVVEVWFGVWLPLIIMAPMGAYITWQSVHDAALFDRSSWLVLLRRLTARVRGAK